MSILVAKMMSFLCIVLAVNQIHAAAARFYVSTNLQAYFFLPGFSSIHPFVYYQSWTWCLGNESILLQIGTSGV